MKKKVLAILLSLTMVLSLFPASAVAAGTTFEFSDMPSNWSTAAIQNAVSNGLLSGYDGKIMPEENLTRAQMAAVVNRAFGTTEKVSLSSYTDVVANAWYYNDMAKAVQMKTFVGSGGKLYPDSNITREEAFVVLARAFKLSGAPASALEKFSDKALLSSWAKDATTSLIAAGYIAGSNGRLNPKQNLTRAEFAQIMDNLLKNYIKTAGTYTSDYTGNLMINVPGVTLKDIKITGDLIIGDGVGNGDVILDGITVTGKTIIRGGGVNSIKIIGNSNLQNIIIARVDGQVRVYSTDGTEIGEVIVDGSDHVTIEGNFGAVTVTAPDITVTATSANIVNATIDGDRSVIIVSNQSTIDTATIEGDNAKVIAMTGAKIGDIIANGDGAIISGTGTISTVKAYGNNTAVTTPGTSVTAAPGSTGNTAGVKPVTDGATEVVPIIVVGGGSSGSSNGNSSGDAAALALTNAKTAAAVEIGKVAVAQLAYTTAGGINTAAVYTDVTAAKDAVDAAVTANVTADILSTTAALTTKLGALTNATTALVDPTAFFTYTTSAGAVTITGYTGAETVITIPSTLGGNPVTNIGANAFENKTSFTSVTIPDSVTNIGNYAFKGCSGLSSITIGNSVTNIWNNAFQNCTGLTSVSIPISVTYIRDFAFSGCTGLTSITIPSGVTSIGQSAFSSCTGLSNINLGSNVTIIMDNAFYNCTGLTSITIPSSVTFIGQSAFFECTGLIRVTIARADTNISDRLMATNNNLFRTAYTAGGTGTYTGTWNGDWTKLSNDASLLGGTLGGVALSGTFTGQAFIGSSSGSSVTVPVGNQSLVLNKSNANSTIKYVVLQAGNQPTSSAAYTQTYETGNTTIDITSSNDRIWLMVTAEDGTTIRYLWIIVTAAPPTPVTAISDISGVAKVGVELTAGTLTPVDATATYQWTICETADGTYTNIVGATTNKYTPVAGDATKFIKVVATGTGSYTGTATSAVTATVAASASLDLTNTTLGGVLVMDDPNSMGETGADESNAIRLKVGLSGSPDYYATAVFVPVTYDNTTVTAYASDGTSGGTYNALAINYNFSGFDPNRVLWVKVVSEDASAICYYRILVLTT